MYVTLQRRNPRVLRGLGDDTTATGAGTILSGASSSIWFYIGGALALFALIELVRSRIPSITVKRKPRRARAQVSGLNTAILAAGAGAGGYLLGKYTGL